MLFGMPRNEATVTPVIESACDYHNSIIVLVSADNVTDMM